MLAYAADTLRGTITTPGRARGRIPRVSAALDLLFPVAALAVVALNVWSIAKRPGDVQNYLYVAWGLLLVAHAIRKQVRPAGRVTALLGISAILALGAVFVWNAAQAPGDWVYYFLAASPSFLSGRSPGLVAAPYPAGRDVLHSAVPVHARTIREFLLDPLTPREQDLLARALRRVADADQDLTSRRGARP
jgi:hypothetical protein